MEDVKREIDDHMHKLEHYIRTLNTEIKARTILIAVLEQTDAFYHNQRGEVKVVANVRGIQCARYSSMISLNLPSFVLAGVQKFRQSNKDDEKEIRRIVYQTAESYTIT